MNLGFNVEATERAAVTQESQFDIHSQESIFFHETVLKANDSVLKTLKEGLVLDFFRQPGTYYEDNNNSAKKHMNVVREKVQEWKDRNFVEEIVGPELCCSPLSVLVKYDPVTEKTKYRLVLDLSRHVNQCIVESHVKPDDLSVVEAVLEKGDF